VVKVDDASVIKSRAEEKKINFRYFDKHWVGISIDETTIIEDLFDIIICFENESETIAFEIAEDDGLYRIPEKLTRTSAYLTHPVFNSYHSESQMLRYIKYLENKDLSLNTSMI